MELGRLMPAWDGNLPELPMVYLTVPWNSLSDSTSVTIRIMAASLSRTSGPGDSTLLGSWGQDREYEYWNEDVGFSFDSVEDRDGVEDDMYALVRLVLLVF